MQTASEIPEPMTVEEFLEWSAARPEGERYELVSGRVVAMAPERNRHNKVKYATWLALTRSRDARGLPCDVIGDGTTVRIDDATSYQPDVAVQCGDRIDDDSIFIPSPIVLVEVLSPSTSGIDRGEKLMGYFSLPSVRHYLMIDPVGRRVAHHARRDDGRIETAITADGVLRLDPPGLEIAVADLFAELRT